MGCALACLAHVLPISVATLFLIRHGEPESRGVFLGQSDPPLSTSGQSRVRAALSCLQVTVTYCSTLRRARQTADLIPSQKLVELPELKEIDMGDWTGKTWREIETGWGKLAADKSADWLGIDPPNGESWSALMHRVRSAWQLIRQGPEPVAVVAHFAVNAALANLIDGRDPLSFSQQYGEAFRLHYD